MRTVVQEAAEAIKPPKCSEEEASEEEASEEEASEEEASEKEASSGCDYASWAASLNVDSLVTAQNKIIGLAAVADKKRCLPESMPSPEETSSFLQSVLLVHEHSAASTDAGKNRLQEAYLQLVSFQQGFVSHAEGIADRGRLLSRDIGHACPEKCGLCNRYRSPAFGFHCLTKTVSDAWEVRQDEGLTCTPARRFSWFARVFRKYNYEMQCTVADWKQAAVQQVQISASMSCASTVLAVGVRSELTSTSRYDMFTACMGHQQTGEMGEAAKEQYKEQLTQVDDEVSQTDKAVVGLVLSFGQVSGLAALRAASRGNRAAQALLETDEAAATWDPALFIQPFEEHLLSTERDAADPEEERKDLAMYGDKEVLDRDAVMTRLEKSKAAQLQGSTDVVAVGTMPLVLFAIENRGVAEDNAKATSRKAAVGVIVAFAFVFIVVGIAFQLWLAHLITMFLLSFLSAAGAAKVILYILGFLVIGLPGSNLILKGFGILLCFVSGNKRVTVCSQTGPDGNSCVRSKKVCTRKDSSGARVLP